MILAKIIGSVVSTIKHDSYQQQTLLLAKPISPSGKKLKGVIVATDLMGAGKGDIVLVASEGRAASELLGFDRRTPIRSIILAVVDPSSDLGSICRESD